MGTTPGRRRRSFSSSSSSASRCPMPIFFRLSHRGPNARNGAAVVTSQGPPRVSCAERAQQVHCRGRVDRGADARARMQAHGALRSDDSRPTRVRPWCEAHSHVALRPFRHHQWIHELDITDGGWTVRPKAGRPGCQCKELVPGTMAARRVPGVLTGASAFPARGCRDTPARGGSAARGV